MSKLISCLLIGCIIWTLAAPAYAGSVQRTSLTQAEVDALAAQQAQDADELNNVAAGDGVVLVLAIVGVVFLVLYVTGNIK
jgi:Tfp pilus assembly protein PilE